MTDTIVRTITVAEFRRTPGLVVAPVHLTDDMSDYVRIVKSDLLSALDLYGVTHVSVVMMADGDVGYIEGHKVEVPA